MEEKDREIAPDTSRDDDLPPPAVLPKWVPILIGLILIGMAGLALWTGLKYRDEAFRRPVVRLPIKTAPAGGIGAPGEPQAGASRMSGDAVPDPHPATPGENARFSISNQSGAIAGSTRISASRGMLIDVKPESALVYVNGKAIGEAKQFSDVDSMYEFAEPGNYNVRIVEEGFGEADYTITADPDSETEVAIVKVELQPK